MDSDLYDRDFYEWTLKTANHLKAGDFHELDITNLLEEIESMSRSQKSALRSNMRVLLQHLLKYKYQAQKRTRSWISTIDEHRLRIQDELQDSPSLKPYVEAEFGEWYATARKLASRVTDLPISVFPVDSPFTVEEALDFDFLPED